MLQVLQRYSGVAAALLAALIPAGPARGQELPPGPGSAAAGRVCGQCHGLEVFSSSRKTADEWDKTINKMVEKGLNITDDDYQTVLDYLSRALGVKVNVNKAGAADMVAGLGISRMEADAMVAYRKAHGPFKGLSDLGKVEGVDSKKVEAKKDSIEF